MAGDRFEVIARSGAAPRGGAGPLLSQNARKDNWPDWSVYKMNAAGSGQVNLTSENPGADLNAAWAPDGQEIVLDSSYLTTTGLASCR